MRFVVTQFGSNVPGTDITPYILADQTNGPLAQELERRAFQRSVDDVTFTLSNLRGVFTAFFFTTDPTTHWLIEGFTDTRRTFQGFIENTTIKFSVDTQQVTFTAFSKTKKFWDRAKVLRFSTPDFQIPDPFENTMGYLTYEDLQFVLNSAAEVTNLSSSGLLFTGIDCGRYASRQIRWWSDNAKAGNEGRIRDLDPTTTWNDFLQACAMEYNAEFFVDPLDGVLRMASRGKPLLPLASARSLDGLFIDDSPIDESWIDDQRIDWLAIMSVVRQPAPYFSGFVAMPTGGISVGFAPGQVARYISTVLIGTKEICESLEFDYTMPPATGPTDSGVHWIKITVPPTPIAGATSQSLYHYVDYERTLANGTKMPPGFYLLKNEIPVAGISVTDAPLTGGAILLPSLPTAYQIWESYDEQGGGWTTIINSGQSAPDGEIMEVNPQLTFIVSGQKVTDPYWTFCFFGKAIDFTSPDIRDDWVDMFRAKRGVLTHVKGTDYRLGDPFVSVQLNLPIWGSPNYLIARKASVDFLKEETELTVLTL